MFCETTYKSPSETHSHDISISTEQIETFRRDGILVVPNVLTRHQVEDALKGLNKTLNRLGVYPQEPNNDEMSNNAYQLDVDSARALSKLSSTNGSGGVLDIFYEDWKLEIGSNPRLFQITQELWKAAYCHNGETKERLPETERFRWHPFGAFDCNRGYMYIDRIGYRLPTKLSDELGECINLQRKKRKVTAIQRSLTPHFDCCPDRLYENIQKWRPIQCFVALTDNNLEPNMGGFEAAKGFHQHFDQWRLHRPPTLVTKTDGCGSKLQISVPAPCVGEYTHIRPKEDVDVMRRIEHISGVSAGSAVLWDNRIPHANAYRHDGNTPRIVVYCSFLPDVELNRRYVLGRQLVNFKLGYPPTDTWIHVENNDDKGSDRHEMFPFEFSSLGRKLMGLDSW